MDFFETPQFLEDKQRLRDFIESEFEQPPGSYTKDPDHSEMDDLMRITHSLAVICAARLRSAYKNEQSNITFGELRPRVILVDADDWARRTWQKAGIREQSYWSIFQEFFFAQVQVELLNLWPMGETFPVDSKKIFDWVATTMEDFRHYPETEEPDDEGFCEDPPFDPDEFPEERSASLQFPGKQLLKRLLVRMGLRQKGALSKGDTLIHFRRSFSGVNGVGRALWVDGLIERIQADPLTPPHIHTHCQALVSQRLAEGHILEAESDQEAAERSVHLLEAAQALVDWGSELEMLHRA